LGNVRTVPLAASVPLFAATKAEKAFGFSGNRVYLTQVIARNSNLSFANKALFYWRSSKR